MAVAAIFLALGLLIYLAYRGLTLLLLAPAMALLAAALSGGLPPLAAYTQVYMTAMGQFIVSFFPLFLLGAVFGKLMEDTRSAEVIAERIVGLVGRDNAILAVVLCCAVLTYGGVSLFVVAFAVFPLAVALFKRGNVPLRLMPAAIALGAFTFTMSALPGTPAIQNAIPMPYFGTTAFAAPGLGIIAGVIMFGLGMAWLNRRARLAAASGEGYGGDEASAAASEPVHLEHAHAEGRPPPLWIAAAPIVLVVAINFAVASLVLPRFDHGYLAEPLFGATTIESVRGLWAIIVALTLSSLFVIAANWGRVRDYGASLSEGANASLMPIANTASLVGFGAVVAALPAFETVTQAVLSLGQADPLLSLAVAVNVLSAVTGSASGGMSIALSSLGPLYVEIAREQAVSLDAMHRVTSISSGALDALPHNGAVITVLAICGVGHAQAYRDIFMVAVAGPMIALAVVLVLANVFGGF